jgi:hypothetical protein
MAARERKYPLTTTNNNDVKLNTSMGANHEGRDSVRVASNTWRGRTSIATILETADRREGCFSEIVSVMMNVHLFGYGRFLLP